MRAVGSSGQTDIWIYVRDRLIDNWIGIIIGFAEAKLATHHARRAMLRWSKWTAVSYARQLANQIAGSRAAPQPPIQQLAALEQQLLSLRTASRSCLLMPLMGFSATFITLKAIAANLEQITQANYSD